jgi:hypothetical protein
MHPQKCAFSLPPPAGHDNNFVAQHLKVLPHRPEVLIALALQGSGAGETCPVLDRGAERRSGGRGGAAPARQAGDRMEPAGCCRGIVWPARAQCAAWVAKWGTRHRLVGRPEEGKGKRQRKQPDKASSPAVRADRRAPRTRGAGIGPLPAQRSATQVHCSKQSFILQG